jgi:hypothetical protein
MTIDGSGRTKHLPGATPQEPGPDEPWQAPDDVSPKDDGGNSGDVTTDPSTGAQG